MGMVGTLLGFDQHRIEEQRMTPQIMEILLQIIIVTVFLGGGFTLLIMKMRYAHLRGTNSEAMPHQEVERLSDTVDNLRAELGLLREDFRELNERVDFTERLLERPKPDEQPGRETPDASARPG